MPEHTVGVHVDEVPSGSKPIDGVSTSVAALVGFAKFGPLETPVRLSSWGEFVRTFGNADDPEASPFVKGAYLAHAVFGFFHNGGSECYVVRVGDGDTALDGLAGVDEVTMVCAPEIMALPENQRAELQRDLVTRCERSGDRMAILDAPPETSPRDMLEWRAFQGASQSAALYYPWIEVMDPVDDLPVRVPPCGHVAGVWARTDAAAGVHKAPANQVVLGATGLPFQVTAAEQDAMNPQGINCIRSFPGRGILIWGARTMAADQDSEWRYIPVRRLFHFVSESISEGTLWAVFEPNDASLWTQLRIATENFLLHVWRDGALVGATPREAFFVKCDETTNPPDLVEAGQVTIQIGIAPMRPSEFIVFSVSHDQVGADPSAPR
jgi:phage tail sheath protein FI